MKKFLLFFFGLQFMFASFVYSMDKLNFTLPNYSYHKFDNGFELILVENHTNPLIAPVIVVRTGLRNETPEDNGVSHMLEHMTFNGTDRRTQKELYDELDFYGIYLNAQTSEDYTTYMALNHKDKINQTLDIMSDMLFHSTFPPEKFEKEKGIIAEEIRKDSENPDFKKEQALREAFYKNPPYSMPVIGTVGTVRNMTRQQVIDYYSTYYSPNNMIAIVIGDFKQDEMLALFRKYFGEAKAKAVPARKITLQETFPFLYTEEGDLGQVTYIKLPAPTFQSNDFVPFQFLNSYAFDSDNGKLIDALQQIDSLKIKRIRSSYEFHPEFGVLTFNITTEEGIDSAAILKSFVKTLDGMKSSPISQDEIRALKQERAISEILQTEKILYYGFLKSQELAIGGIEAFEKTIPAFLQINDKGINRFKKQYPSTWRKPSELFKKGNWTEKTDISAYRQPPLQSKESGSRIYRRVMDNGMTVLLLQNNDNPVLAMHFLFKNRSAWEPEGKTGIADFLHHLLFKSSKNYPANELQLRIKEIGAEIKAYDWDFIPYDDYYNVPEFSYIRFVTLDQFYQQAIRIAADNILYPDIDSVFAETEKQMAALAARKSSNASAAAKLNFNKLLFGPDHPLARPVSGTPGTISAIRPEDLKDFRRNYFTAGNTILTIVSGLDSATIFRAVEDNFAAMPVTEQTVVIPEIPLTVDQTTDSTEIGSRQSYIYLGYSFHSQPADRLPLEIMNQILSGRIAFTLREQKGWAYRLGTSIDSWRDNSYFYAYMGTGRETIHPAIQGILDEIRKFKSDSIDSHMVQQNQNSLLAALARRRASRENQAFTLGVNEFYGYPINYFYNIYDRINAAMPEAVRSVRDQYLQAEVYKLYYTIPGEEKSPMRGMPQMPPRMPR